MGQTFKHILLWGGGGIPIQTPQLSFSLVLSKDKKQKQKNVSKFLVLYFCVLLG